MLYCFREAQAAERWAREVTGGQAWRMRVCKSLSEYKQWRPKVAKTQDGVSFSLCTAPFPSFVPSSFPLSFLAFFLTKRVPRDAAGLSDYELRELNDRSTSRCVRSTGRTRSLRWARRITYRRNVAMLDDDGKEVPGT
ncbi:hypothetical protein K438DRAFT_969712 [Mycena galopus ATCC 62051]|nr:hypothetical protein K438DRAFT_969712 [Mycena galopus ATCC 62051]